MKKTYISIFFIIIVISSILIYNVFTKYWSPSSRKKTFSINYKLLLKYAPILYLSRDEPYFPIRYDFDNNTIPSDNYYSYLRMNPVSARKYLSLYCTYRRVNDEKYAFIYIAYYVFNSHKVFPDHMHDWDTLVILVFSNNKLMNVRLGRHGLIYDYSLGEVSFIGEHPAIYVAEGSHGAYAGIEEMGDYLDVFNKPPVILYPGINYTLIKIQDIVQGNSSFFIKAVVKEKNTTLNTPVFFGRYLAPWFRKIWINPIDEIHY